MIRFSVGFTGFIAGMGLDHVKRTIPHRFEGGNGTAEIYPTEDGNEVAILSKDRHCTQMPDVAEEVAVEEPQEAVREAPEATEVQEEAEEPEVAPTKYTREEWVAGLSNKNYQTDLLPMADSLGVKRTTDAGKQKKKKVLVEELADAYVARQDGV